MSELERLAPRFQWIEKNVLAVSWYPNKELFDIFQKEGIRVIINCSDHDNQIYVPKEFEYHFISIKDGFTPTYQQLIEFLTLVHVINTQKLPLLIHCRMGCGRTGVLAVAWGYYTHRINAQEDPITWIRSKRPACIETNIQEDYVRSLNPLIEQLRPTIELKEK